MWHTFQVIILDLSDIAYKILFIKCDWYISELVSSHFEVAKRSVGETCQFENNENCFFTGESTFDSLCCTPNNPCGILQGGCNADSDCYHNLECVIDSCPGLNMTGAKCCQAPGRAPGLFK